ncbi:MAG TPA: hypothetical protein VGM74_12770 [Burkholderiaceae bacterium]|jgi:hypothetical protein
MTYSGEYKCSGCDFTFSEPVEWRERRLRPRRDESDAPAEAEAQRSV